MSERLEKRISRIHPGQHKSDEHAINAERPFPAVSGIGFILSGEVAHAGHATDAFGTCRSRPGGRK